MGPRDQGNKAWWLASFTCWVLLLVSGLFFSKQNIEDATRWCHQFKRLWLPCSRLSHPYFLIPTTRHKVQCLSSSSTSPLSLPSLLPPLSFFLPSMLVGVSRDPSLWPSQPGEGGPLFTSWWSSAAEAHTASSGADPFRPTGNLVQKLGNGSSRPSWPLKWRNSCCWFAYHMRDFWPGEPTKPCLDSWPTETEHRKPFSFVWSFGVIFYIAIDK